MTLGHRRSETLFPWLLALLALGYVVLHWSQPPILFPDSGGYLQFSEHRTAGYPLFLWAVDALFGSADAAPKVQLVIAAGAFAFLGWSLHREFRSPLFSLAAVIALLLHPRMADLHGHILTESIFISLLSLMAGGIALACHRVSWRWLAVSALACGLAITVRPAGLSLLVVWPFLFWLVWRRSRGQRVAILASVVIPVAICMIGESMAWHAHHDSGERPNLADRHLFAKALVIEPQPLIADPDLAAIVAFGRDVMAPARALTANAPSLFARFSLLREFEVTAQHETYRKAFSPAVRDLARQRGVGEYRLLAQIGRPAILSEPVAWAGNAITHYLGLWSWAFATPVTRKEFQSYVDGTETNPLFERTSTFHQGVPPGSWSGFAFGVAMGIPALVILVAVVLVVWQRFGQMCTEDTRLEVAAMAALAVHSHLIFVGTFGVMIDRYADAMAPMAAMAGALLAAWIVDQLRRRPCKLVSTIRNRKRLQMTVCRPGVAVLLPCLDEEVAIAGVVEAFRRVLPEAQVYVYDNGSTDATAERAAVAGAVVRSEPQRGKGNAVRRMFADVEADVYVLADGDGTYDASAAPVMVDRLVAENLDMVVGVRVETEGQDAYRPGHRMGNALLSWLVRTLFGAVFTDISSGYRVMSRRFVKSFPALSERFENRAGTGRPLRSPKAALRRGANSLYRASEGGESKLRTLRDGRRALLTIGLLVKEFHPFRFFTSVAVVLGLIAVALGVPIVSTFLETGLVPRLPTAVPLRRPRSGVSRQLLERCRTR